MFWLYGHLKAWSGFYQKAQIQGNDVFHVRSPLMVRVSVDLRSRAVHSVPRSVCVESAQWSSGCLVCFQIFVAPLQPDI